MSRKLRWIITALLILGAFATWFVVMPSRKTELQSSGLRAYGTITNKDSRPVQDGTVYAITFIYQDDKSKNYQVTVQMLDQGRWDSLKVNQDIKDVYYIPGQEGSASIPGGERMVAPHSSALSFIAWSLFIAGLVSGYMAYSTQAPDHKPKRKNKVTIARH